MPNILIVDDDEELLEMVCLMIKTNKMNPTCIGKCSGVMPALEKGQFDFILMDIFLDSCDGRQLTRLIKQDERFGHIPIMLYSAGNIEPDSVRASLANDFMQKPFEMETLVRKIREKVNSQ